MCGYSRKVRQSGSHISVNVDLKAIDARLLHLEQTNLSTPYARQKTSLQREFEAFLTALPGNKSLFSATPKDVCRFLIWKDKDGKTQVHINECPHFGKHGIHSCSCPV